MITDRTEDTPVAEERATPRERPSVVGSATLPRFLSAAALLLAAACNDIRLDAFDLAGGVVVRDLDGDGRLDAAVTMSHFENGAAWSGAVFVFLQDPAQPGTFLLPAIYRIGLDPRDLVAADFDGDGRLDLAASNLGNDSLSVLLQDPAAPGTFLPQAQYATPGDPVDPTAADLDADGRVDLAVTGFDLATSRRVVAILFQVPTAPGTFAPAALLALPTHATAVTAADLDGDLRSDLVAGLSASPGVRGSVAVLLQDPGQPGSFLDQGATAAGFQPIDILVADLDGDGLPDVTSADLGPFGDPAGAGLSFLRQIAPPGTLAPAVPLSANVSPEGVRSGDLDGDAVPDLIARSPFELTIWLQEAGTRGTFTLGPRLPSVATINGLDLGDLDGDGLLDIATGEDGSVVVRLQDPAAPGTFLAPVRLAR